MEGFDDVVSSFSEGVDSIVSGVTGAVDSAVDSLLDGLNYLFVPEDEYFSDKLDEFKNNFAFVGSVSQAIERIQTIFTDSEFGEFYVNLSAAEGKVDYGDAKINILDVSWYSRYKPLGDNVISAILWVTYIHSLWRQLPGIINGAAGGASSAGHVVTYFSGKKE